MKPFSDREGRWRTVFEADAPTLQTYEPEYRFWHPHHEDPDWKYKLYRTLRRILPL